MRVELLRMLLLPTQVLGVFGSIKVIPCLTNVLWTLKPHLTQAIKTPQLVLSTAERNKKSKYNQACESYHASFTPLCITVDRMLGAEFKSFLKCLGDSLSVKWDKNYSATMYWIKCKLSFAVIRAINLCLRGSHTKWRGIEMEDGSGINPFLPRHQFIFFF